MNIKRAKQEIKDSIEAYLKKDSYGEYEIPSIRQRPILLMGPPGIGKTQIMEQIARECEIGLVAYTITHHTRQSAVGLPFIREKEYGGTKYSVTEYTMSEILATVYEKIEKTGHQEGILFIDEINCVSETLAPTMLQFLQNKMFGNQRVPEGWMIVAAGNPPEYNKSVREFDVVTLDRMKKIDVEPDYEVWKEYAYRVGIHGAILSYLEIKKECFYRMETTVDGKAFVTARGWEDLSQLMKIYEKLGKKIDREVTFQYLQHSKIAKDFSNYYELYKKYKEDYKIEGILKGQFSQETIGKLKFASFDETLSIVGLLNAKLSEMFYDCWKKEEKLGMEEKQICLEVLSCLEAYHTLTKQEAAEGLELFDRIREKFAEETQKREALLDQTDRALTHAFEFMEQAFGESQEMVVFVTELNVNYFSVWYLQENQCDKYFQYNKGLLFDEQQQSILSELDELEKSF